MSEYVRWRRAAFASASGDCDLTALVPAALPPVLSRLLHLATLGKEAEDVDVEGATLDKYAAFGYWTHVVKFAL